MEQIIPWNKIVDVLKYDPANPLLFNTGLFLILFTILVGVYTALRRARTARMLVVIAFSMYFYYKSSAEYCLILAGTVIADYCLGLLMGRSERRWQRVAILTANVLINIGMLVYFKYLNLILETVSSLTSTHFDALDIILPAGISFFAFRSISYITDVYRGTMEPCRSFLDYAFFLTFFPPLLMGPVVRAKDMLPQIKADNPASRAMVSEGFFLIMGGLIKKVIVADFISGNFVDRVFDNPALYSGFENLMAIYGFFIQLYCDFSGYSDMAIGIALLLGFRFKENFDSPFKSESPTEFWRRWHISLSMWLRDYIYIPLGGNRCGRFRTNLNLMVTMVLGGLWHGASWMFVIWGTLQGVLLVVQKGLKYMFPGVSEAGEGQWWRVAVNMFVTFNLIAVTFLFFRAQSMEHVYDMAHQIFGDFHSDVAPQFVYGYFAIVMAMLLGYFMHLTPKRWVTRGRERFSSLPLVAQAIVVAVVILVIIQVRQSDIVPFIYLQY